MARARQGNGLQSKASDAETMELAEAERGTTGGAQSIRRALKILRVLASGQEHGVRLTDIVDETGLTRPTVHRILTVLIEEQAVEQEASTRRYMIGQEVSLLGLARPGRFPIRAIADPYLRHLVDQVGDTVYLTIRSGFDSICVDRKLGTFPVKVMSIEVGVRRPLGVGVGGLSLLATLPEEEAEAILRANQQRYAHHRLTLAKLNERLKQARTKGYAYAQDGIMPGTGALAVPILDRNGEALAAISIAAISNRMQPGRVGELLRL
ncbi:MAG TPA: IclR family transcriptional regulator, partial [Noviherbaspirillum sp.]